jgi:hypothetical protein
MKNKKVFQRPKLKDQLTRHSLQDRGAIVIITALLITAIIGFAALAIDVGFWYSQKRQLQLAADAGAIGGAWALSKTGQSSIDNYVIHDLSLNNCTAATNCTIVAINNPPTSGTHAGNSQAVEVILSKQAPLFLAGIFLPVAPTLEARAVALLAPSPACLTLLGSSGSQADLTIAGNGQVNSQKCNINVNSSDPNAVSAVGNAVLNVQNLSVVGGTSTSGNATINASQGISTGASPATDPDANFQIPTAPPCTSSISTSKSQIISQGSYCGFSLTGQADVTMNPGVYYIDGGNFSIAGQASLTGNGVTIIMTNSSSASNATIGSVSITGGGNITLTPPTTGPTAGFSFITDRRATSSDTNTFAGGSSQNISGTIYMPTAYLKYAGNSSTSQPCLSIIAYGADITGGASLGNGCVNTGGAAGQSQLVE